MVVLLLLLLSSLLAQRPLDLPSGGIGQDEEEDSPEVISFYGNQYEGDGFYWCLDKSGSMLTHMPTLKAEMAQSIGQLSSYAKFGIVAFSVNVTSFSTAPSRAFPPVKAAAIAWVNALTTGGQTYLAEGAIATLAIAHQDHGQRKTMILLGDGMPFPQGPEYALEAVTAANYEPIPINTIFLGAAASGWDFMQELANLNGGTASQIQ